MKNYVQNRESIQIYQYGLWRRARATSRLAKRLNISTDDRVLDIGTADGRGLKIFMQDTGVHRCVGIDYKIDRIQAAKDQIPEALPASGRSLPFKDGSFSFITSIATIKHVCNLDGMMKECWRVLKPGGYMIVVDPTPLGVFLGILLRHFRPSTIQQILGIRRIKKLYRTHKFTNSHASRFMLTPIPFKGCDTLEKLLQKIRITFLFFNQMIAAQKP